MKNKVKLLGFLYNLILSGNFVVEICLRSSNILNILRRSSSFLLKISRLFMGYPRSLFIILLVLAFCSSAKGEIITTYSIDSITIKDIDKLIDKDTIVFVELDEVLVMPKSKMFSYGENPYRLFISNLVTLAKGDSRYLSLIAIWYQMRKLMLVEEQWKNFINKLKKRGIPVYGFCTMPLHLQNIEQKRFLELKELGIIFTEKINDKDVMEIDKTEEWSSNFYHGIIFTGAFTKSKTLLNFIKITNISPKKIMVFDKIRYELESIERAFTRFRINFYGILYWGARQVTDTQDSNVIRLQQKTLIEKGKWLEDNEAEVLIKPFTKPK
jgi:hypothetical protein